MEKITETTETITKKIHEFYCDECDCLVGSSEEYPDGGYLRYGMYSLNVLLPEGLFKYYDKCLCDACKESFPAKIQEALEELGFTYYEGTEE